jgi:asparagine synthase (glutamine-hydrolysing)
MKSQVLIDSSVLDWSKYYSCLHNVTVYSVGWAVYKGRNLKGKSLSKKLVDLCHVLELNTLDKKLGQIHSKITGNYSFIIESDNFILAVTDLIRSFPVYYYTNNGDFYISNSPLIIKEKFNLRELNQKALLEFKMSGYCLYGNTLYKDIHQLNSGSFIINSDNTFEIRSYHKYYCSEDFSMNQDDLVKELHRVNMSVFTKIIKSLEGRPVWIPLSGGYDSRFVLSMFKSLGYENITTYTYGVKGLWEAKSARFFAKKIGVKWIHIPFTRATKKIYYSTDCAKYLKYASGYNSVPHLSEYYALTYLINKNIIPDDAVIINGQSGDFTSGDHIPNFLINSKAENQPISVNNFMIYFLNKHFSLWENYRSKKNDFSISKKLRENIQIHDSDLNVNQFYKKYEQLEFETRQEKFVINGQRAYEWLGYDWRLPLWHEEYIQFWLKVPLKYKKDQKLYAEHLKKYNYCNVFNLEDMPKKFSYFPLWLRLFKPFLYLYTKLFNKDINEINKKYFRYFMSHMPVYPVLNYKEFLKSSNNHRGPVSFWVKKFIKGLS